MQLVMDKDNVPLTAKTKLETFFTKKDAISPGGLAAIGIKNNDVILTYCIGSGTNFRDAKATALRNARKILRCIKQMQEVSDK
jgi:alpha-L-arabinofuranosidase